MNKLRPDQNSFETINLKGTYKPALKNNLIVDIKPVAGSDSLLWIGTETGLYKLNIHTNTSRHFGTQNTSLSNEVIKHIYTDPEGKLWLGTDFGLNIFDPDTKVTTAFFHNPQVSHSIANNVIWQIFEDSGGVIWFATSNGLSRVYKHRNYYSYQEITHQISGQTIGNQIKSVLTSTDGYLWMATLHGVIRLDPRTKEKKIFDIDSPEKERLLLNNVSTLLEDGRGRIWIGTAGGINIWDQDKQRMYAITAGAGNGLTSNYISKFTKGPDGSFWISAWEGGLFRVVEGFQNPENIRFEFTGDFSSPLITYALNGLWAVHNSELFRIDMQSFNTKAIQTFNQISKGKDIYTLYYADHQSIWAGTNNGLIQYKIQSDSAIFHPVVTGDDFELNNIMGDHAGNIWAAAHNKVIKFNTTDHHVELFPLDTDLPLKTFSSNCVTKNGDEEIIFGGDNGYISIQVGTKPNVYKPDVFITTLSLNNKPVNPFQVINNEVILQQDISFTKRLELAYAQRSILFEFAALHYWQPDNNVYAYKLEGFDHEWNYVSGHRSVLSYRPSSRSLKKITWMKKPEALLPLPKRTRSGSCA